MSLLDTVNNEFWQSTARSTLSERCKFIFNLELLSDVTFVVQDTQGGSERKSIPAHKFVLAISSPVFYAMFYGELAETKDSVEISDCDYESLLELFRFIYNDKANLTPDNVMQVMYLAKKYMLPSLADKCSAYLQENLSSSNVFHVLKDAQKYEEKDPLDHCWNVIEKETEDAVKSDDFVTIERPVLEELIENDSLNIREVELFKAVDRWAGKECEKQGLPPEGSVKRGILGERIVKKIDFTKMEEKEFVSVVLDSAILTKEELSSLMRHFSSLHDATVGRSETNRTGYQNLFFRFTSLNNGWDYHSEYHPDRIGFKVDKSIKLHAVRLFGSENEEYSVTLKVCDHEEYKPVSCVATKTGNFLSKLVQTERGDYQGFEIEFEPPIPLKVNTTYEIDANITGPPSLYGQGGLSSVEHSGVTFSFGGYTMSHTSVERGQFSEFIFTLL